MSGDLLSRVLRFKRHLRVEPFDEERVFLIGERERFMLRGHVYAQLAAVVDGSRTGAEIVALLQTRFSAPEVLYGLGRLEESGYLVEDGAESDPGAAFWDALGVDATRAAERLASARVAIQAFGGIDPSPLRAALTDADLRLEERHDHAPLAVVLAPDYLLPELEEYSREAHRRKRTWLLVKPTGVSPWVGPIFRSEGAPCWACLAYRLRANRPIEAFLRRQRGASRVLLPPRVNLQACSRAVLYAALRTLAMWIARGERAGGDTLIEYDPVTFAGTEHPVVPRPQCAVCGDPGLTRQRALAPVVLQAQTSGFIEDGGYRTVPPERTVATLEHQISRLTGVVANLEPVAERDHPMHPEYGAAYFVAPATHRPSHDEFMRAGLGKGKTAAQARASALCEAIERQSSIFQGDEVLVRGRIAEIEGAVDPRDLQNFSERQYLHRDAINETLTDMRTMVPLPFDPSVSIDWAPAWSLTHNQRRHLPASICYETIPVPEHERFGCFSSNGHAAGNCLEEAILQGFLELAERDAVGIWWYAMIRRPGVDLASFGQPYFMVLEDHYRSLGHPLCVLDLTNDLAIPVFAALAHSEAGGGLSLGFGCHYDARLGVQRALTELNQTFAHSEDRAPAIDTHRLLDRAILAPDPTIAVRTAADFPRTPRDLRELVVACVERAARLDLDTIVLDQTRADFGLTVVKVAVPGLRHFWPRLGPGRLYDVPVKLGWVGRRLAEEDVNTVPLFL